MIGNASPPIMSKSVVLRCFVLEDAPKIFAMSQEPGMRTWIPDQVYDSEAHALEVLRYLMETCRDPGVPSLAPYVLGVCIRGTGELIGHVGLSPLDGQIEIGYAIEQGRQGRGFASEAVRAMAEWALSRLAPPRILGVVAADNGASCKVLQNAGFQLAAESIRTLHGRSGLVRTYQLEPSSPIYRSSVSHRDDEEDPFPEWTR
jgi:ribosomal-protein-alanine N-acetyltransferase